MFFAAVTGIGGGTLRDLVLGRAPVFWVTNPTYILVCVGVAAVGLFHRASLRIPLSPADLARCHRLSAYMRHGRSQRACGDGFSNRCHRHRDDDGPRFGGVLREYSWLASRPFCCVRKSTSAARLRVPACSPCAFPGAPLIVSSSAGVLTAFSIRSGALIFGWTFPPYRSRPGRPPEDVM